MEWLTLYLGFHLTCAVLSHGMWFGWIQNRYPSLAEKDYWGDLIISICGALTLGPIDILINMTVCSKYQKWPWSYGFKFW